MASVAAAQPFDGVNHNQPILSPAPTPLVAPSPVTGAPTAADLSREEDAPGVYGIFIRQAYQVWLWVVTPICLVLMGMLDWMGVPRDPVTIDFVTGDVGWYLGVIDAWLPLHEFIALTMSTIQVSLVWLPIRLARRFLFGS